MPELRLPFEMQSVTVCWLAPNYTGWWRAQRCEHLAHSSYAAGSRMHRIEAQPHAQRNQWSSNVVVLQIYMWTDRHDHDSTLHPSPPLPGQCKHLLSVNGARNAEMLVCCGVPSGLWKYLNFTVANSRPWNYLKMKAVLESTWKVVECFIGFGKF